MIKRLLYFIFIVLVVVSQIYAATYYVDATNGSDSNSGTSPATAWKTINKVNNSYFNPGDAILFNRGDEWRERLNIPSSGSSGNPITFGVYGNGNKPVINGSDIITGWTNYSGNIWQVIVTTQPKIVIFDGTIGVYQTSVVDLSSERDWFWDSGTTTLYVYSTSDPDTAYTDPGVEVGQRGECIYIPYRSYVTIENLNLRGGNGEGIYSYQSHHINIQNGTIESIGHFGALIENTYNVTIQNMEIYNVTIEEAIYLSSGSTNGTHDVIIDNCYLHNFAETGIGLNSSVVDGIQDITIRYNRIYHSVDTWNTGSLSCGGGGSGNGIQTNNSKNVDIYYNLMQLDPAEGTVNWGIWSNSTTSYVTIYNNVLFGGFGSGAVTIGGDFVECKNNIIRVTGNYLKLMHVYSSYTNIAISNNRYYYALGNNTNAFYWKGTYYTYDNFSGWVTTSGDSNSSTGAPLFVDDANNDFHLKSASPCIDAGIGVGLTQDYEGNTVPQGFSVDIGSYEYQTDIDPLNAHINASSTAGYIPLTVEFTSNISGGTLPYSYNWDFGDGRTSSEQNPSHTFSSAGQYNVILTVTDSQNNQASDSIIITATEPPSPLSVSASASPTSGQVPLTVNFTGSVSGGTSPYSYSWDFGNGSSSSEQNPSHTYSSAGTFNLSLTVTDANNSQASDSLTITVTSNPTYNLAITAITGSPAPGEGGSTDPSPGNHTYSMGSSVQIKAIPNEGYRFSKWTSNINSSDAYNSEITITMDNNKDISANFFTKCGDVNGDLRISPADAQAAFDIFLGRISKPTEAEKENADVNCDGTETEPSITPADAQAIFDKFLGKKDLPCNCSCKSRASKTSIQTGTVTSVHLIINDVIGKKGEEIVVPVMLDSLLNVRAFGFDLLYPSEVLEFVGVEKTESLQNFIQLDANKIAQGVVRAGGYKDSSIANGPSRVLIKLVFRVIGEMKEPGLFTIINMVDDIKNASYRNVTIVERIEKSRYVY